MCMSSDIIDEKSMGIPFYKSSALIYESVTFLFTGNIIQYELCNWEYAQGHADYTRHTRTHMAECSCSDSCSYSLSSAPPSGRTGVCTPAAEVTQTPPRIPPFPSTVHSLSGK